MMRKILCRVTIALLVAALHTEAQTNSSDVAVVEKLSNLRGAAPPKVLDANSTVIHTASKDDQEVRILHISDTHNLHRELEGRFGMPAADILLFTGDFANKGLDAEISDFNDWLGGLRSKYAHIIVITGNHDWLDTQAKVFDRTITPEAALDPARFKSKLTNALVLDHELVEVMGLKIFGSPWCPWHPDSNPAVPASNWGMGVIWNYWSAKGGQAHRFGEIPAGVDILMTHGPAKTVLDAGGWGSSTELLEAVRRAQPRAHLFGHVHEQRGHWQKTDPETWQGGVEYEVQPGSGHFFMTNGPPPSTYPVQHISNNAVMNHPGLEGTGAHIAGHGRLLSATQGPDGWQIKQL